MYLSTQLHYTQNADDNALCRLDIKARILPAEVLSLRLPPLLHPSHYSEAIEFLPFRHSISGTPFRDAVLPSRAKVASSPHSSAVFLRVFLRVFFIREARLCHSLPLSHARFSLSLSLRPGKIISFIAIPLFFDSSLCARQWNVPFSEHAGMLIRRTTINRLRKTTIWSDMIIPRVLSLLYYNIYLSN